MKNETNLIQPTPRQQRFLDSIEQLGLKFSGAKIAKKMGVAESTVSTYLNTREVSEKFLRKFCEAYNLDYDFIDTGILSAADANTNVANGSDHHYEKPEKPDMNTDFTLNELVESNKILALSHQKAMENQWRMLETNAVIAQSNAVMANTIRSLTSFGGGLPDQPAPSFQMGEVISRIAKNALDHPQLWKTWKTQAEGEAILDKLLASYEEEDQPGSRSATGGKQSRQHPYDNDEEVKL